MTPEKALWDILGAIADKEGLSVIYGKEYINHWPASMFETLKESGMLQEAQPTYSIYCDGCEENCMEPVHVFPKKHSAPVHAFIVCQKRDDIGRVPVEMDRLYQWKITSKSIAYFLSKTLNILSNPRELVVPYLWDLGHSSYDGKWYSLFFSSVSGQALSELLSRYPTFHGSREAIVFIPLLSEPNQPESINCIPLTSILNFKSNNLIVDTRIFKRILSQRKTLDQADYLFRRNNTKTWEIRFAGSSCLPLREKIGYHYIMHLLKNPHKQISRLELYRILHPFNDMENKNRHDGSLLDEGLNIKTSMMGKARPDQKAEEAYRQRVENLQKELREAEMIGDTQEVCKIEQEMDVLTAEIRDARLSKKSTKSSIEMRRQRESVYKAVKSAINSLEKNLPGLGHHLHNRIKSIESEYVYSPQPPEPNWRF